MEKNSQVQDLSYFKQILKPYIKESFPELKNDIEFISTRANEAAECFSKSRENGYDVVQAGYLANKCLFHGLYFSVYDTVKSIITNEFSSKIPIEDIEKIAIKLVPEAKEILEKYPLNDEFAYSPEYDDYYTEITGLVAEWMEENGI